MKKAFVFPGQGAQYPGMGADLFKRYEEARAIFRTADQIMGFPLSKVMFEGTAQELQQTKVTQPAVFLHSVIEARCCARLQPDGVAGHSLGELSALVAAEALSFEDGLLLVRSRAEAMQKACQERPSTMAAVLGAETSVVEEICATINKAEPVVVANYNSPGQVVISGTLGGVERATQSLEPVARRVVPLSVGGAFHSPLMAPAEAELAQAIDRASFQEPLCPIYQNTDGQSSRDINVIRSKLKDQLTAPVQWGDTRSTDEPRRLYPLHRVRVWKSITRTYQKN